MREAPRSLTEKLLGQHNYDRQSDDDFLMHCGIGRGDKASEVALLLRKFIADMISPSTCGSDCIIHDYRIESDLGVSILDSLNLVDFVVELEERTGIPISAEMAKELAELNRNDATIAEIIERLASHYIQAD